MSEQAPRLRRLWWWAVQPFKRALGICIFDGCYGDAITSPKVCRDCWNQLAPTFRDIRELLAAPTPERLWVQSMDCGHDCGLCSDPAKHSQNVYFYNSNQVELNGEFTAAQLRALADYMDQHPAKRAP